MESLNSAFYFVCDKFIELQAFFITEAWAIGRVILLIAICSAALNYGLSGTGLKENIIKILKATVFFVIVMGAYPRIVNWITSYTFSLAQRSTYAEMAGYMNATSDAIKSYTEQQKADGKRATYGDMAVNAVDTYFGPIIINRTFVSGSGKSFSYATVAPAAALQAGMLVAGECMSAHKKVPPGIWNLGDKIAAIFVGYTCCTAVLLCGIFALLEYLMAFLEFILIANVGIILFPLSLWEGSKFMTEKLITAIIGFFIKLMFCTVCCFVMLYGFLSLANMFVQHPFEGAIDQILTVTFTALLFYYITKSAPRIAQSLMSGIPSLNAAGVVGTAVAAFSTAFSVAGIGARAGLAGTSAIAQGVGAAKESSGLSKSKGGGIFSQVGAGAVGFLGSMAHSGADAVRSKGTDLTRSLLTRSPFGGHMSGAGGTNRYSATQRFLEASKINGQNKSMGEFLKEEANLGKEFTDKHLA